MDREKLLGILGKYAGKLKYKQDRLDSMILNWAIMLDSPDFEHNDAGIVKQEMLGYIVNGLSDKEENKQ